MINTQLMIKIHKELSIRISMTLKSSLKMRFLRITTVTLITMTSYTKAI